MPQTIYLVRHTTPAVEKGICYGQSDLDITDGFPEEAAIIRQCLQDDGAGLAAGVDTGIDTWKIYSSPLQRCRKLAAQLFPDSVILEAGELKEIHCGLWEMRRWDHIPREETDPWMKDFVHVRIPGGESYLDLYDRVIHWFTGTLEKAAITTNFETTGNAEIPPIVLFTHGGVIRSILSHITGTPLIDSFKVFSLHYGCVIRITQVASGPDNHGVFRYELLSNIQSGEKEQHKPGTGSTFAQSDHL
jgi:alpha-ribazole phosphatase